MLHPCLERKPTGDKELACCHKEETGVPLGTGNMCDRSELHGGYWDVLFKHPPQGVLQYTLILNPQLATVDL
jgi:hypothetical protein